MTTLPVLEAGGLKHVFACLVHEDVDCVVDLIRNLQFFEPDSEILLYDGSGGSLREHTPAFEKLGVVVHPAPKKQMWGRLHVSVFDCLEFGRDRFSFDAMTFVDSDQLLAGRGYAKAVRRALERQPAVGVLGTPNPALGTPWATEHEAHERELWKPFLERFPDGLAQQFPANWIFWPGTVITAAAGADLCALRRDPAFAATLARSNFASEEICFSTAAAALGYRVVPRPWNDERVRWRRPIHVGDVAAALDDPDAFWLHPVLRRLDDPARAYLREAGNEYEGFTPTFGPSRPPVLVRVKQRAADGFFRVLTKPVDGLAPSAARTALSRARRSRTS
jgi:hypothetical protein